MVLTDCAGMAMRRYVCRTSAIQKRQRQQPLRVVRRLPTAWVRNKRRRLALRLDQVRSRGLLGVFAQQQDQVWRAGFLSPLYRSSLRRGPL